MDKELIEVFKEFDSDSKGYINPRILQKVLKHLGFNPSDKEMEQLIVDVDESENWKIELDEFIEATKKLTCKTKQVQEGEYRITQKPLAYRSFIRTFGRVYNSLLPFF